MILKACAVSQLFSVYSDAYSLQLVPLVTHRFEFWWRTTTEDIQATIRNEANLEWIRANVPADFLDFTINIRNWCLLRILEGRFPAHVIAAGGLDEARQSPKPAEASASAKKEIVPPKTDPWITHDPWTKRPPRPPQSKWEDLIFCRSLSRSSTRMGVHLARLTGFSSVQAGGHCS